jgi:alkyl hydroperoxide reductase subunit AhpC
MSSDGPKKRSRKSDDVAPPSFVDTLRAMIERDASDAEILRFAKIPMIQKPAPAFVCDAVLPNEEFSTISLSDYTSAGKWLVLFYYPLDFTFVCPTEIIGYSEAASQFQAIGCEVLAASCDSKHSHLAWMKTPRSEGGLGKMQIPILADFDKTIATEYGCLLEGGGDNGVPCRALFIIDPTGTVRHITMNDPPVGRNVDETLRLVKGYQYTDEHGEVCPANWTPGDATMVADPKKSKEGYFSKMHK